MKTTSIFLTFASIFILGSSASGMLPVSGQPASGKESIVKESRNVGSFTGISVGGAFNVFVKQTGTCSVEVEATAEIMEYITTRVEGNVLKIGMKKPPAKCWDNIETLNVYVTMDQLKSLDLSGACEFKTQNQIKGSDLDVELSGAVEADLDLQYTSLDMEVSGATEMELTGSVTKVTMQVSGASELDADECQVTDMEIYASGASEATVYVTGSLKISASGACDVKYKGNPAINLHTSGASDVRKID